MQYIHKIHFTYWHSGVIKLENLKTKVCHMLIVPKQYKYLRIGLLRFLNVLNFEDSKFKLFLFLLFMKCMPIVNNRD